MTSMIYDETEYDYTSWDNRREKLITAMSNKINDIEQNTIYEEELRNKYPSLQDAWEKYQIILKTVGG